MMYTYLLTLLAAALPLTLAQTVTYEAESGTLNGVTLGTTVTGFSGTGYVEGFVEGSDSVTINVPSATQKLYDLEIVYAAPYGEKQTTVVLNGGSGGSVVLAATNSWATVSAGQVLLKAGSNTITLQSFWGWYLIDAIKLTPSAARPPHKVTGALVNSRATSRAKKLMRFLVKNYGVHILSGQQDPAYITWIEKNVGKTPAIVGLDMMDYSPSRVERGTTSTAVEDAVAFHKRGGIVTFVWHWNAPTGLLDTEGHEWWRGFYTNSVNFNVATALADTTNANYTLLIRDIDAIAVQLKRLQSADIPILWRPLHEADGKWFWWGAQGAEPCKKLWNIMYDRLTNYHKINNLVWVWNSVSADWYPSDSTVDVLSYDSYPTAGDHGPVSSQYNALVNLGKDRKLIAATEVGTIPDPDQLQLYEADWSWFVTWGGEFVDGGVHNSLEFLKKLYASEYVLTLDEIKGWLNS